MVALADQVFDEFLLLFWFAGFRQFHFGIDAQFGIGFLHAFFGDLPEFAAVVGDERKLQRSACGNLMNFRFADRNRRLGNRDFFVAACGHGDGESDTGDTGDDRGHTDHGRSLLSVS